MKKYILLFSIFVILLIPIVNAETVSLLTNTDRCIYNKQTNKDYCEAEYEIEGSGLEIEDINFLFKDDRESILKNYHRELQLNEYEYEIETGKIKVKISGWKNPFYNIDHVFCYKGQCEYQFAWWNTSFRFKYPLNASCENCSNDVTSLLLANGTNGIFIDGLKQLLWCEDITIPNTNFTQVVGYMYFNNASDTICVNVVENSSLDTFVDEGNATNQGSPEDDLDAWYTMNGSLLDMTSNNYDLINNGSVLVSDGKIGHARDFENGDQDYVETTANVALNWSTGLTVCTWFKFETPGNYILMEYRSAGTDNFYFYTTSAGQNNCPIITIETSTGTKTGYCIDNTADTDWHFGCAVWDTAFLMTYIDGELGTGANANVSAGGTAVTNTNKLRVGNRRDGLNGFDGYIDNAMVWVRALNPDEIKVLSQLEFSLGELQEVEAINTSVKHFDIGIDSFLVTSSDYETIFNGTANITTIREIVIKSSANARKQSGTGTTSVLSMKIIFNNVTLMDQTVRSITGTNDIGVFTIPMLNATTLSGNNNLAIQFKRTTGDPINVSNLVIHIDLDISKTDGVIFKNITKTDINFNSVVYTSIFNYSISKATNSTVILDVFHQFESDTSNIIPECYFENLQTGEKTITYKRFLGSIGDVGSSGINYRSETQVGLLETWELLCKADKAGNIINNITVYLMEQRDSAAYFINGFQNQTSITGISGSNNVIMSNDYINQNGSSLEIITTIIMQSTTGAQQGINSPNFTVRNNKSCSTTYSRSLSNNNDIGTAKFYLNCVNLTVGEVINYEVVVDLSNTELLNILNASITSYETEEQNISETPVLPIILITSPQNNSIVEDVINITALVIDLSNVGWSSEILLFNTTGFVATILNEITLENTTNATFDTETVENGNYTIQWIVTNIAGADSDNVSIIISNLPPIPSFNATLIWDVSRDLPIRSQSCSGNDLITIRERESCTQGQCQIVNQTDVFECQFGCSGSTISNFGRIGCIESDFLIYVIIIIIVIFLIIVIRWLND